jgi:hypothetical protein
MVTDEEFTQVVEAVNSLGERVLGLEKRQGYLRAWIDSLEGYVVQTSDWKTEEEKQSIVERLKLLKMSVYDSHMKRLETKFPDLAARLDIRDSLSETDRELWYGIELPQTPE